MLVLLWVAASTDDTPWSDTTDRFSAVFLLLAVVSAEAARRLAEPYVRTLAVPPSRRFRTFIQFTPGCFAFHGSRANLGWKPIWLTTMFFAGLLALGWCVLVVLSVADFLFG